jgi:hypothetical protein
MDRAQIFKRIEAITEAIGDLNYGLARAEKAHDQEIIDRLQAESQRLHDMAEQLRQQLKKPSEDDGA